MERKLFVYGGQINREFVKYTALLTGKRRPKVCFLPTATGDSQAYIDYWYQLCEGLDLEPFIQRVWISSYSQSASFEEILGGMDAIIAGGGNTLNMLAIWKAQEIDLALKKAYEKGVVLAGGSAGSVCWFNGAATDSRPGKLSIDKGLSIIDFSHCAHYHSDKSRRPLYFENIKKGLLSDGYACDDLSGIVFVDEEPVKSVSLDGLNHSYFVYKKDGEIKEDRLVSEIID